MSNMGNTAGNLSCPRYYTHIHFDHLWWWLDKRFLCYWVDTHWTPPALRLQV